MHPNHQQDRRTVKGLLVPLHAGASDTVTEFALIKEKGGDLLGDDSFLRVGGTELLRELPKHLYRVLEVTGVMRRNHWGKLVLDADHVALPKQCTPAVVGNRPWRTRLLRSRRFAHHHP